MKIWIDDVRKMPSSYNTHVKTYEEAIKYLETGKVTHISFDHDLGTKKSGYDIAKYIERKSYEGKLKPITWTIHSANPVGSKNITYAMMNADKYWKMNKYMGL
jgi:hypothetical protein